MGDDVEEVTTVYVGNLPPEVDEQSLLITFSYFGPIDTVQVRQPFSGQPGPALALCLRLAVWLCRSAGACLPQLCRPLLPASLRCSGA